ncbi:MAG: thiamine pyrophosphate-binding protein [Gallionellaceae bacterium]
MNSNKSKNNSIKVSQYIAQFLKSKGVRCVYELSGGMIMDLIDTLHLEGGIDIVNVQHEQNAAFAADATGRLAGIPGVAIATSGPGAINLLTGVGSCFFDSSPAVFITGQVKTNEQKGEKNLRQLGFQETDIVSMAKPITKFAFQVRSAEQIPSILEKAFCIAAEGRPGSVLVDIPMEMFRAVININTDSVSPITAEKSQQIDPQIMMGLMRSIRAAKKPLILVGGGVRASGAILLYKKLVAILKIPVVSSLLARDCIPCEDPSSVGMIGTYGNRWANLALAESDFLLVLGSRLDIRQTGANTESFKADRTIYHVAVEEEEINNRVLGCQPVVADMNVFLSAMLQLLEGGNFPDNQSWITAIGELKKLWPDIDELKNISGINPNQFMHKLSATKQAAVYTVDVGQHQMWAAQSLEIYEGQRFLTSGGMGAMGFALPAAIGAAFATNRDQPIVAIAGDAGFQLSIQELQTVVRNRLPIKIIVINNRCHGMTRQFQETYFEGRYQATVWGYDTPDFAAVARAYGINSAVIKDTEEIEQAVRSLWADPLQPYLLEVIVDTFTNVYPKMAFGKPISEMEPFSKPIEMEGT